MKSIALLPVKSFLNRTALIEPSSILSVSEEPEPITRKFQSGILNVSTKIPVKLQPVATLQVSEKLEPLSQKIGYGYLFVNDGTSGISKLPIKEPSVKLSLVKLRIGKRRLPTAFKPSIAVLPISKSEKSEISLVVKRADIKVRLPNVIVPPFATLQVNKPDSETFKNGFAVLKVINRAPDYISIYDECENLKGEISELKIPVKVGEFSEIAIFEGEEIEKIYNKPFSIQYEDNKIYGRLITKNEITMQVKFKSGKVIELTLIPYFSDFVKVLIPQ
jgi:hypothetical protein